MPQRLSRFLLGHKLAVVAAWLLVLVAGVAAAGAVSARLSQDFSFPGEEGYEANVAILRAYGTGGPGNPLVPVITLPGMTVDSPGVRSALAAAFAGVAEDRGCACSPGRRPPPTGAWSRTAAGPVGRW